MFWARLRVKRMSAYEQPRRFASASADDDQSRYFGSRTAGACSRDGSNARAYAQRGSAVTTAPAVSVSRNFLREGCMIVRLSQSAPAAKPPLSREADGERQDPPRGPHRVMSL